MKKATTTRRPRKPKLSALIREGAKLDGPQVTHQLFETDHGPSYGTVLLTGACALGKAAMALYKRKHKLTPKDFKLPLTNAQYKELDRIGSAFAAKYGATATLVVELNDERGYSLAKIASHLERQGK